MLKFLQRVLRWHRSAAPAIQWVDPSTLQPGPIQHDTLSVEQLGYVRYIHECLEAVDGLTLDARIDLFRRDLHIDQEIHIMAAIANGLRFFATKHDKLPAGSMREVYRVLLLRSMATRDEVLARAKVEHLHERDVHELMELLEGNMSRSVGELSIAGA
jgi:hypothetical protein